MNRDECMQRLGLTAMALVLAMSPGRADAAGLHDYLGQTPPGTTPRVFAPGFVSTELDELNSVFSPDGRCFLFGLKTPDRSGHVLLETVREAEGWTEPRVLPFSGRWPDADPAFSADGTRLYFISRRPVSGDEPRADWDLFEVARGESGWGEPRRLPPPLNSEAHEVYPGLAADGTLYFSSSREGGEGGWDIYYARARAGAFEEPVNLGRPVNTEFSEGDLFIAPDQSYLVFNSSGRDSDLGRGDLYVAFREDGGGWTPAVHLGPEINSDRTEYCPVVSPDGRFLFYTSYRIPAAPSFPGGSGRERVRAYYGEIENGLGNIYWVDAAVLEAARRRLPPR